MIHIFKKEKIILSIILLLGLVLRLFQIGINPPSLNWDEVSIGYNAYSILKTGRDEWGEIMPLHFKSYGEYKLPVQIYASIPAIAVFGLNPFGVRITPVIYGVLTILIFYFLTLELFKDKKVALLSAFLLSISPWHIQLTRASFESSFSVFWVLLGILFLIKSANNKKLLYLIISSLFFAVSVYTYNSARVFSPLFLLFIGLYYFIRRKISLKNILVAFSFFALLLIPLIPFVLKGDATARYKLVSITNEAGLIPRINERRGNSTLPKPLPRLIHNKVTYISYYFTKNYLSHFSPDFLFVHGANHRQHHVQGVGELYLFQAPFLLLGLYFLFKKKDTRFVIILCLMLAFVPVATTRDSIPNALRTVIANPVFQMLTALGLVEVYKKIYNKKLFKLYGTIFGLIVVFELLRFSNLLFNKYASNYSRDWQYGNKEVVEYIKENYNKYDLIVYTRAYGEPHMFTLFYMNYDPVKYQTDPNLERFQAYDWVWVTHFDKFYFPNLSDDGTKFWDIVNVNKDKKILFIGKTGDFPDGQTRVKTINFLNGDNAFDLVEMI